MNFIVLLTKKKGSALKKQLAKIAVLYGTTPVVVYDANNAADRRSYMARDWRNREVA